jgi:hypothetical protein
LIAIGALLALAAPAGADTLRTPGDPRFSPDPPAATGYRDTGAALVLTRPASRTSPGYTLTIARSPFELTTARDGRRVVTYRITPKVLADVSSRRIHLPPGQWYDVERGKVVSGDIAAYPVTLADVPMFVRLGTPDTGRLEDALRRWSR